MSLPIDIDEMPEERLVAELQRRAKARGAGLCDYCTQPPTVPACKFPDRHAGTQTVAPEAFLEPPAAPPTAGEVTVAAPISFGGMTTQAPPARQPYVPPTPGIVNPPPKTANPPGCTCLHFPKTCPVPGHTWLKGGK